MKSSIQIEEELRLGKIAKQQLIFIKNHYLIFVSLSIILITSFIYIDTRNLLSDFGVNYYEHFTFSEIFQIANTQNVILKTFLFISGSVISVWFLIYTSKCKEAIRKIRNLENSSEEKQKVPFSHFIIMKISTPIILTIMVSQIYISFTLHRHEAKGINKGYIPRYNVTLKNGKTMKCLGGIVGNGIKKMFFDYENNELLFIYNTNIVLERQIVPNYVNEHFYMYKSSEEIKNKKDAWKATLQKKCPRKIEKTNH
ncbi:MAG: hypothetical protein HRT53_21075 [Colwellia sp.]|nr:hypothetical protein [Colwellia sp.]